MRRIFTELRQLIDHPMKLRSSNFGLAHYALSFHNGSNQNGKDQNIASDTASHSSLMLVDCNFGLLLRGRECPIR
ncbi:hypothetical protein T12_6377 [Trichinella patagoniensis]|uniref:Uncharacterized protein n=1 Tax=Trichinella patagoniensis TaxID=990121 RepID=A0A0V0Z000_9BILA|nr:hypothetical protein T12_6377 [Trichinella patagoniensis]